MINKKMVALTLVAGIAGSGVLSSASVFAAEKQEKPVRVSYSNTQSIPDPSDPDNPAYVVNVPAAITFTDNNKEIEANVSMTNPDGTQYAGESQAVVKVSSDNDYKLQNNGDELAYTLKYDGKVMTNKDGNVGTLNKTNTTISGKANLPKTSTATKVGVYTDRLVYSVSL